MIEKNGIKRKLFYGMSSSTAMKKHKGGVAEYRASEGKTVEVDYRGDVEVTMLDVLGGLRSACTYVGAGKVKEMPKRTTFIRFGIWIIYCNCIWITNLFQEDLDNYQLPLYHFRVTQQLNEVFGKS